MAETKDKKVCFVITPIGDNNSEIRRHIDGIIDQAIEPALGEKYEIVVAHRKYEIGSINDRVIKSVFEADLVIANLTTTNPNVMYELAIRYSFGKPAIVIAEEGTKLPFDVIDENTSFYINDPAGASDLKQALVEYERNIDFGKKEYGPVYKTIKRIPLYNEVESGKTVPNDKVLQYVIERLDSLEKNISLKRKNESKDISKGVMKRKLMVEFTKDKPFKDNEVNEILDVFALYAPMDMQVTNNSNKTFDVFCTVNDREIKELIEDIDQRIELKKDISYQVMYGTGYTIEKTI